MSDSTSFPVRENDHFKRIRQYKESKKYKDGFIYSKIEEAKRECKSNEIKKQLDDAIVHLVLFYMTAGVGDISLGGSMSVAGSYKYNNNIHGKKYFEIWNRNQSVDTIIY